MDDIRIVDSSKHRLTEVSKYVSAYVDQNLGLRLNPNKTRIIRADKTIDFLGAEVKRFGRYANSRTLTRFAECLDGRNKRNLSSVNSYLGYLKYFRSDRAVGKIVKKESLPQEWEYVPQKHKIIINNSSYGKTDNDMGLDAAAV